MRSCFVLLIAFMTTTAYGQTITTVAGNGTAGYTGDGGNALLAQLNGPFGVAADAAGNLFIADRLNNRIRKVDAAGVMTTIAGTETGGYNGDSIAATTAQLYNPTGVATDAAGNLYIADKSNNRIRKVATSGIITTIAGTGANGNTGDGGPATTATLANPYGLAVDGAGNVYIADQGNNRVRRIDNAGAIHAFAGTGATGFSGDAGVAVNASLHNPYAVACDGGGNVYIADVDNQRIRMVNTAGIISTIAGNGVGGYAGDYGPATDAQLFEPIGVAVDALGTLYIADAWNHRIRAVTNAGLITSLAGTGTPGYSGDGGHAASAQFKNPNGVAVNSAGDIFVADYNNHAIRHITKPTAVSIAMPPASFTIYPNPSQGTIQLFIPSASLQLAAISICNAAGKMVFNENARTGSVVPISLSQPAGVYFYSVTFGDTRWQGTLVLSR